MICTTTALEPVGRRRPVRPHQVRVERVCRTSVGPRTPVSATVSERTYRRRRSLVAVAGVVAVVVVLATAFTVVGAAVSGTLAGPGGVPASATGAQPSVERATVIVRPGDTLWSIAHEHRGDVAHGRYLDELVLINGGASIQAGQRLVLP